MGCSEGFITIYPSLLFWIRFTKLMILSGDRIVYSGSFKAFIGFTDTHHE